MKGVVRFFRGLHRGGAAEKEKKRISGRSQVEGKAEGGRATAIGFKGEYLERGCRWSPWEYQRKKNTQRQVRL